MADVFCGTWTLVDSQNFDEYLRALGVDSGVRKAGNAAKPTMVISRAGDRLVFQMLVMDAVVSEISFRLGEEFEEQTADGRRVKSTVTLDGGALVQIQRWDGKETTFIRELQGHQMVMTASFEGVQAVRTYDRA